MVLIFVFCLFDKCMRAPYFWYTKALFVLIKLLFSDSTRRFLSQLSSQLDIGSQLNVEQLYCLECNCRIIFYVLMRNFINEIKGTLRDICTVIALCHCNAQTTFPQKTEPFLKCSKKNTICDLVIQFSLFFFWQNCVKWQFSKVFLSPYGYIYQSNIKVCQDITIKIPDYFHNIMYWSFILFYYVQLFCT